MAKTTTTITLDVDVLAEVRVRRIKLSPLLNSFLKSYLNIKQDVNPAFEKEQLDLEIADLKSKTIKLEKIREANEKAEEEEKGRYFEA